MPRPSGSRASSPSCPGRRTAWSPSSRANSSATIEASLVSRINNFVNSSRINQSAGRLDAAVNRALGSFTNPGPRAIHQLPDHDADLSISQDATTGGGSRSRQFMAQQVVGQFGNSLASLSQSFPYGRYLGAVQQRDDDHRSRRPAGLRRQLGSALGVVNYQLANNIGVFRGLGSTLAPTLQQAFFGNGQTGNGGTTGFTNLYRRARQRPHDDDGLLPRGQHGLQ